MKKIIRETIKYGFWIAFLGGVTAFILLNSLMDVETSHQSSGVITNIIAPNATMVEKEFFETIVRKLAHLMEFACLGIGLTGVTITRAKNNKKCSVWFSLFYILAVGVADEHLQSFSNRNSSTGDILLDFSGGVLGMGFMVLFAFIIKIIQKKVSERRASYEG